MAIGEGKRLGVDEGPESRSGELRRLAAAASELSASPELDELLAAIADEGRRYDELARRAGELDAVYRLTDAVSRAETIDDVFQAALDSLESAVGVDRASVVLFDDEGAIHFGAWRGISDLYRERVQGRAPWRTRSPDPTPFVVPDVFADPEVADLHETFRDEGIHSMVLVPLVHTGVVLGRFVLYGDSSTVFTPEQVQLAETMASHVAAAAHRRRTEGEVRESRNQLQAIFRSVGDGITVQAADGSIVYANEAAARFSGFDSLAEFLTTPGTAILDRFELLGEDDEPLSFDQLPGRVALAEGRECERVVQYRFRHSGERRWSFVRATPVLGEDGRATLAINVFHDLTEERRAGDRLRVLADAGRTLSSSLAVNETLAETARLLVPAVADYCLIDLLADDGSLTQVTHVHVDPEGELALAELRRRYPVLGNPAHPVSRVVATREPHLQVTNPDEELDAIAIDAEHRELYRQLAPTSFLAVPLVARGRTLGAISLGTSTPSMRRLSDDDLQLAIELAERAALAVDNALLYQEAQAEVAERQRTEGRLRALGQASEVLAGSLDYEGTLRRVAGLVVPSFADWCIVYEQRPDGSIRRLAIEHSGGRAEEVREVLDRFPLDPGADYGVPAVVRTGVAELVEDESAERLTRDVDDPGGLMQALGDIAPRSSIRVPLIARGRTLGAISLLSADSGRSYGPDDLVFASELARRAALAVDNARLFRESAESLARLDTFLGAAQVGLAFVDTELRFVQVNEWMATVNGVSVPEHIGRRPSEIAPSLAVLEPLFREVLSSGRPIIGLETGDERGRFFVASYYPVREPDREVLGVGAIVRDVTEERREQIRGDLRTRSGEALAASLDPERTLREVAELAVAEFADACTVFLVDPTGHELQRVAAASADQSRTELFGEFPVGFRLDPESSVPAVRVLLDGEPLLVPRMTDELVSDFVRAGINAEALARFGTQSFIVVPLRSRAKTLGVIAFTSFRPDHFGDADLATATEVARRAGVAVDNARLYADATETLALLDALFATAPAGLAFFDTDVRYVRVNEALADINGVPAADHVGRRVGEVLPDMDPQVERDLRSVIESGEPVRAEVTGITPAVPGEARTWIADYYPVVTPDGRTLGLGAVVLEITERKRSEARLRESEARFRRLADTIPALVWMSDVEGGCTYFNRRWLEFTGRTMEHQLGEGWYEQVHPDDTEHVRDIDLASLRDQAPFSIEYRLRRHDGQYRWVIDEGLPRFTSSGEFAGHIGACIEIDDRKRAESRQRFLAEASTGLAASLDVEETLNALARLAVPRIADWCSIVLREDDGTLRTVAVAHEDPDKISWARELQQRFPPAQDAARGAANVIRTGEPELMADIPDELLAELLADQPDLLEVIRELGLRSSLVVPLVARGRAIGALTLVTSRESGRRFGEDDVSFAQDVARRAAVAVDNARLFRALDDQSRLTATITDNAASALFMMDAEGRTTYMNPAAVEVTGWTLEEIAGLRLHDVLHHSHPDGTPYLFDDCPISAAVLRDHDVRALEDYHFRRDGSMFPIRCSATPIVVDGVVQGALLELLDITEERRARAEADARAQAAQALEFVGDGVFLVDADGIVRLWNRAAEAITGLHHRTAVGTAVTDVLPGWDELAVRIPVAASGEVAQTRPQTLPFEIGERERWLSISGVTFPHGTVYAFRDLTEEYAVERLKTDFVSTVSHELRTPLAAIYGAAMTLQRTDISLGDDQRSSLLNVVAGESERLARIVNDVLWASRLDSGVLEVAIESCDAGALATAVVAAARAHLPPAIELTLEVVPDTPAVAADPDKVRQVLVNLVDNAVKYSPDGGLVAVRVEPADHTVRFAVSDRGLGIPPAEHGRIFEKFFRLDPNLTRGVGGTGLGLYICRELVRRMDGRIWVESEEGRGSTFGFELPMASL